MIEQPTGIAVNAMAATDHEAESITTLTFSGVSAVAADYIIANTSLCNLLNGHGWGHDWPLTITGDKSDLTLSVRDDWRWSSGEERLLNLLDVLSGGAGPVSAALDGVRTWCDSTTYGVCAQALADVAGLPTGDGKHRAGGS